MATDLETVRLIIADPPQFDRAVDTGDGVNTQILLPNAPVITGTVSAWVGAAPTIPAAIDERLGLITFVPPAGDGIDVTITYQWQILLDDDLQTFLDLEGGNIKRAAAQALDTIASSEAMVQKRITLLDLQTDGPATANALRQHAKDLRREAEDEIAVADADGLIDYAEMVLPPFTTYPYYKYKKEWEEG
jgi:hypothetical protein